VSLLSGLFGSLCGWVLAMPVQLTSALLRSVFGGS
jgi:hypothetical protein